MTEKQMSSKPQFEPHILIEAAEKARFNKEGKEVLFGIIDMAWNKINQDANALNEVEKMIEILGKAVDACHRCSEVSMYEDHPLDIAKEKLAAWRSRNE